MEWKKGILQSLLKLSKEKLFLLFCLGMLLFVMALPSENKAEIETVNLSASDQKDDMAGSYEEALDTLS